MKRIVPRLAAEQDIDAAADYYADQAGDDIAHGFVEAVRSAYRTIGDRPGTGSPRYGKLADIDGPRSRKVARFPYLVFYVEREHHIDVLRVLHLHRDIPAALGK
ncbi:MAG TPA: type II toxin-antitoxin system RelE/ParE family toxin [Allosphingosinicella sp.]|nr:type II toxin-antitoxin system RelE/ParE family toxin [Allosphingosinicella sp.]